MLVGASARGQASPCLRMVSTGARDASPPIRETSNGGGRSSPALDVAERPPGPAHALDLTSTDRAGRPARAAQAVLAAPSLAATAVVFVGTDFVGFGLGERVS